MFVNEFIKKAGGAVDKFAATLPPEREDGQPEAKETDSVLVAAIKRTGIPITVTDYEIGVESLKVQKYSPDQPRDEKGRFGSGGKAAENASTKEQHEAAAHYHAQQARSIDNAGTGSLAARLHDSASATHQLAADRPSKVNSKYAREASIKAHAQQNFEHPKAK